MVFFSKQSFLGLAEYQKIEMVPSLVVVYVACLSNPALSPLYSVRKPSFLTTPINTDIEVGFCPPVKKTVKIGKKHYYAENYEKSYLEGLL